MRYLGILAIISLTACSGGDSTTTTQESDIIGGVDAKAAKFSPVGAILYDGSPICTATLIAPTLALTAEHCLIGSANRMEFAVGYDAKLPEQKVRVYAAVAEKQVTGGFLRLGADVALLYLRDPIRNVAPAALAPREVGNEDILQKFVSIGFGQQDTAHTTGTRKLGTMTMSMLSGKPAQRAFPTYEEFASRWMPDALPAPESLRALYDASLIEGYEAYLARESGDVGVCSGDSGGPLLGTSSNLTLWGVASWVPVKNATLGGLCEGGAVYATFGPVVRKFLDDTLAEEAICGGVRPHCEGTVAVRCPTAAEGDRTITRVNCATLGLSCSESANAVACVDPVTDGGTPPSDAGPDARPSDGGSWPTDAGSDARPSDAGSSDAAWPSTDGGWSPSDAGRD